MKTEISIEGAKFLINGTPTYQGVKYKNKTVEGLLMNSRMIQAIFDDENPTTRENWKYPDTGKWDADRNTDEFCAHLPVYRAHGLLAVTVGLQGGGSIYKPEIYSAYRMSAFSDDGVPRDPYFERLSRILDAADRCGMIVIVNYFYWKQVQHMPQDSSIFKAAEAATGRLLRTGFRNILVDVANESGDWWNRPVCGPDNIHKLIDIVKNMRRDGRRLLVGCSTGGTNQIPAGVWLAAEDFSLPHGNGCTPKSLAAKICRIRKMPEYRARPRPIIVNEDGVELANMDVAVGEYASWGYYAQGAGSGEGIYDAIWGDQREKEYGALSGFQTVPVNWGINTPQKQEFFAKVKCITGGK
jgi:hypothetical protein